MASVTAVFGAILGIALLGLLVLVHKRLVARAAAEAAQRRTVEDRHKHQRELDLLKDEFLSLVSYELRSPLTSIRGYLELILEDEEWLAPNHAHFMTVIARNADRLQGMVCDLLFISQAGAGQPSLDWDNVDLARIVNEAVEAAHPHAWDQGVELDLAVDAEIPLIGDPARLAQAVENLLSNALKFTPEGGHVSVTATRAGSQVRLQVADTGIGISEEEQQRLFDRFYRAEAAAKSAMPGAGLGLAIAKAIVEAHDGEISVESRPGEGATFSVTLPAAVDAGLSLEGLTA